MKQIEQDPEERLQKLDHFGTAWIACLSYCVERINPNNWSQKVPADEVSGGGRRESHAISLGHGTPDIGVGGKIHQHI